MKFDSTEESADTIFSILKDEARSLGANIKVERTEKRNISNEMVASLKRSGQTFRITLNWVRDEYIDRSGFALGNGYIETEWDLRLEPEKKEYPVRRPFRWKLKPRESVAGASHPHILEDAWLRQLIRKKLAVPQSS